MDSRTTLSDPPMTLADMPGLITREKHPQNLEFHFATLQSFITPTGHFYVRNHFPVPELDTRSWRLTVEGAVECPLSLSYDEVLRLPARTFVATIECAGNSRIFLSPKVRGVQWELGAVGTAEWTGAPLAAVLERAGVRAGAADVVLEGADAGEISEEPRPPGPVRFARSLPLEKARQPDVILAYRMNGEQLAPAHGFPLRAVVPGWYGMASIKWLTRIVVTAQPFQGFFQTVDYAYFERRDDLPVRAPVTEMQVKAAIARPAAQEVVPAGRPYRMRGAAWAGESDVARVEVSVDGGRTWEEARLLGEPVPYAWRLWEYEWQVPAHPGGRTVMARATDARGRRQPVERDRHFGSYMISHVLPVDIEVR
jgi:DMSO/TMAO reductase YedYZ molybdopterin-dependent catalytic subunit